jgi:hypothetical protein
MKCKICGKETNNMPFHTCNRSGPSVRGDGVVTMIEQLYKETNPGDLKSSLYDDGVTTPEDAYVLGFHHALAELKMRIDKNQVKRGWGSNGVTIETKYNVGELVYWPAEKRSGKVKSIVFDGGEASYIVRFFGADDSTQQFPDDRDLYEYEINRDYSDVLTGILKTSYQLVEPDPPTESERALYTDKETGTVNLKKMTEIYVKKSREKNPDNFLFKNDIKL